MNIYKGIAAGVAGGLAGSLAMNQFQELWGKLMENEERPHGAQSLQQGSPEHGIGRELAERGVDEPDDNAAVRTGNAVSEFVLDHHLTKSEKETAGAIAHYAMGVTSGAIYGAVAEVVPAATVAGRGPLAEADRLSTLDSCLRVRVTPCLWPDDGIGAPRCSPRVVISVYSTHSCLKRLVH
jgi:hypothetical protein